MAAIEPLNPSEDLDLTDYPGNCHCGAFKFIVKLPTLERVFSCDCALCSRNAYLWVRPVLHKHFIVVEGADCLKAYRHGTTNHKFCPTCGSSVLSFEADADPTIDISINVRTLTGVVLDKLSVTRAPCELVDTPTNPPAAPTDLAASQDDTDILYHANCHCGAISYTLRTQPLARTKSCNCSICSRSGALWTYPPKSAVTVQTQDSLVEYSFGRKAIVHGFCGICGVPVWEQFLSPTKKNSVGVNVRLINGLDWVGLPTKVHNGAASPPQYEMK
ncbi:Mss4-like protein [Mycena vulgaris]|nr:Mss4-like protein [Mycena vulgaris]